MNTKTGENFTVKTTVINTQHLPKSYHDEAITVSLLQSNLNTVSDPDCL